MTTLTLRNKVRAIAATSLAIATIGFPVAFASIDIGGNNDKTGQSSQNENEYDINSHVSIDVRNDADANNNTTVAVLTGENDINKNTTVDGISSGDIDIAGDITNRLNIQSIDLGNIEMGDISADFSNDHTGQSSKNENELKIHQRVDVDIHNRADINNNLSFKANTGQNKVKYNTTVGDIRGGDVSIDVTGVNEANTHASQVSISTLGGGDVSADFSNGTTGQDSENENSIEIDQHADYDIHNTANINNNFSADVNSGQNDVNSNTTVGDVSTGNVNISFSSHNTAN